MRIPTRFRTVSTRILLATLVLGTAPSVWAGPQCEQCGEPCREYDLTPCTVMVRALVLETRMKTHVVETMEKRTETYTVFVKEPIVREIKKEICYLEDDVKTQTVVEKNCRIVEVPVHRVYEVKVPHTEIRDLPCECDNCTAKGATPTLHPTEVVIETKEQRSEDCVEPRLAIETTKKDITYCVKVPKKRTEICATEHTFKLVPQERTRMVEVCVCRVIKEPCEVTVCKMVPKEIKCCDGCASHHGK